jgi:Uma2 family endonuclease
MTVEQFRQLPERGAFRQELHHGEVFTMPPPKLRHGVIQGTIRDLLMRFAEPGSYIEIEVGFRPLPEYEVWVADVAYVSKERYQAADLNDNFHGAPDIVIEVLSPSNTLDEMNEREQICLQNGAKEFWVVDQKRRHVKVSTPDGVTITNYSGQEIPLRVFGGGVLKVNDIFA